jgi:spore coat polysaccharide biosynthesis protein SpsF (cytidylyltransferase family)
MVIFMLRRLSLATTLDRILVATSDQSSDDGLAEEVIRHGYSCFRGDLSDVLSRFVKAAQYANADIVVRLTGDCPLMDPDLIDRAVTNLTEGDFDYVSNVDPPTYPDGLDVEAMRIEALMQAHQQAIDIVDREHVTPFIRRNKAVFRQTTFRSSIDLSSMRWTVDYQDDLDVVAAMVDAIDPARIERADRFDFLRVIEGGSIDGSSNQHARNEKFTEQDKS